MRRTSTWATVALAVLAVVALVLVFASLRNTRGTVEPAPLASASHDSVRQADERTTRSRARGRVARHHRAAASDGQ